MHFEYFSIWAISVDPNLNNFSYIMLVIVLLADESEVPETKPPTCRISLYQLFFVLSTPPLSLNQAN